MDIADIELDPSITSDDDKCPHCGSIQGKEGSGRCMSCGYHF